MADATVAAGSASAPASASSSHQAILKSTAVIGGSSVVNIVFAVIRNKAVAMLVGADGIGLMGLFSAILDLAQTLAGFGLQSSGVRQTAEADASADPQRFASTTRALRLTSLVLAIIGAVFMVVAATPVATVTFADSGYASAVAFLGLAVFCRVIGAGQAALIQGVRHISHLAIAGMVGAALSTIACIGFVYAWGMQGIMPAVVAVAASALLPTWWFARKIGARGTTTTHAALRTESVMLLRLGAIFVVSGLLTFGAAYLIRIIIVHEEGVASAGYFQAAWAIGGMFAGFILQAMGTDFYPRLTAIAQNSEECNRVVNEQAQVSILLAGPGLLATLTAAPLVMMLFYTPEFLAGVQVLQWICLGMMLRIVAWPMGYIIVARDARRIFFWTEVAATVVHVGLAWLLVRSIGLTGAGMAFFGLYIWHTLLVYVVVRKMTGFRWSTGNLRLMFIFLAATAVVFSGCLILPLWPATALGSGVTVATGLYSLWSIVNLVPQEWLPHMVSSRIVRRAAPEKPGTRN